MQRSPPWDGTRAHPRLCFGRLLYLRHAQRWTSHCKGQKGDSEVFWVTPRFCIILLATYSLLCQFVVLGNLAFWTTFNISDPLQPPVYFELFSTLLATFRKMLDKPHNPLFSSRTSKAELGALPARSKRGWRSGLRSTWPGSILSPPLRRWEGMLGFIFLLSIQHKLTTKQSI